MRTREARRPGREPLGRRLGAGLTLSPSAAANPRLVEWYARLERLAASPGTAARQLRMTAEVDVRAVLGSIQAPTLVLHREEDKAIDIRHSRYLAEHIPGARYLELPGDEALPFGPEADALLDEIEEFLTGARHAPAVSSASSPR